MDITIEDAGPCRKMLHVKAAWDAVAGEYETVADVYAKAGRLRGFRKGKAPRPLVERQFASDIAEDVKDRVVPGLYREALKQEELTPVAVIDVHDVALSKGEGVSFKVTLDVAPDFKLPKYKKISLKRNKVVVEDKDVDEAFKNLLERNARFEAVEDRPVGDGDLAIVDYRGTCEGAPVSDLATENPAIGQGEDFSMLVGGAEFLPGLSDGIKGMAPGTPGDVSVRFADDYAVPALAGKEAVYSVVVKRVREKVLPTLDGEFFKRFEVDSESALREKLRQGLLEQAEQVEQGRLREEVAGYLRAKTSFDVPESVVEQETRAEVNNIVRRIAMQGATREQIEERSGDIINSASEASRERVRLQYILFRIAEEEKIEVGDAEVDARLEGMAGRYGMSTEQFKGELEKKNGLERVRSDISAEKTMAFLMEHAKIK